MEFKPTKLKLIFSGLISLLICMFIIILSFYDSFIATLPNFLVNFFSLHDFSKIFNLYTLLLFLVGFVIVYIIYSLFEKKENKAEDKTTKISSSKLSQTLPSEVLKPVNATQNNNPTQLPTSSDTSFNLKLPDVNPNLEN